MEPESYIFSCPASRAMNFRISSSSSMVEELFHVHMSCDAIIQDAEIFNQCHDLSAQKIILQI